MVPTGHGIVASKGSDDCETTATVRRGFDISIRGTLAGRVVDGCHFDHHVVILAVGTEGDEIASIVEDPICDEFGRHEQHIRCRLVPLQPYLM